MTSSRRLSAKDLSAVSGGAGKKGPTMASNGRAPGSASKSFAAPRPAAKKPKR
jgi:hypothetical protein